jgi:pimeloyl-ACP methyl ester carboxylesterase
MHFTAETSSKGVLERDFTVGEVTGVLWSPASASEHAPLVLMGHGGGQHKKSPGVLARAHQLVTTLGFSVAAVDLPGHGDRPPTAADYYHWSDLQQARAAGSSIGPVVVRYSVELAERAVPEWQTTLDALQELPEIGTGGPVGYSGAMLSTAIGVRLMAVDPRITAGVFRCFFSSESLLEAAGRVTAPIQLLLQWHDTDIDRQDGLALFDAFASKEKTMHANAGAHHEVPEFEADSTARFFARHLGQAGM